ncbi:hypothetical protein MA16_Dca022507 [Dendrobium catenatum]|uniref:Uncharacterized protein n=1 Tax=Dendrobium catenatum TaxID=906689 RepID=A0A2I0VTE5_9ASPA|nr:hypothetical protein MA16_Dca022507 [Dendrobium catenatum]
MTRLTHLENPILPFACSRAVCELLPTSPVYDFRSFWLPPSRFGLLPTSATSAILPPPSRLASAVTILVASDFRDIRHPSSAVCQAEAPACLTRVGSSQLITLTVLPWLTPLQLHQALMSSARDFSLLLLRFMEAHSHAQKKKEKRAREFLRMRMKKSLSYSSRFLSRKN